MHRLVMKYILRPGLLVMFVVAGSACAGGDEQQQAKARPLPENAQDLRAGEYHTDVFEPPMLFSVGKGWTLECPEAPDYVCLIPPGGQTEFKFLNVQKIYKPSKELTLETAPAPDDLVGWLEQHPYLQTDQPKPVSVGGIKGAQFDAVLGDLPEDYSGLCGTGCVYLFELSDGDYWAVEKGHKYRLTVLENLKGETVTIDFGSPAEKFDEFWPRAHQVLDTMEWDGT